MAVVHEPSMRDDGTREWRGRLELPFIERRFLSDVVILDRVPGSESNGAFTMGPDGRLRAEMVIGTSDGRRVIFRGERISNVLVDARW